MLTHAGARLYSFQSWPVNQGESTLLALVGSQMYDPQAPRPTVRAPELDATGTERRGETQFETTALSAFEQLVARLPFGVAVATIGPQPRVVYGNTQLLKTLGLQPGTLTGRPLIELIPDRSIDVALREAVDSRRSRTLGAVLHATTGDPDSGDHLLRVAFRPSVHPGVDRVVEVLTATPGSLARWIMNSRPGTRILNRSRPAAASCSRVVGRRSR